MATAMPSRAAAVAAIVLLALCALAGAALAELTFPRLSGRVVDAAHVLDAATLAQLDGKLAAQEAKATDQFVVATIPSLQGTSIEDYANRLFRAWKLGQEKKNNGVLLLVAPAERKVRIEVGYGLEGILTDAVSSTIIQTTILPAFRQGDMAGGIVRGADAVLEILNLDPEEAKRRAVQAAASQPENDDLMLFVIFVVVILVLYFIIRNGGGGGGRGRRGIALGTGAGSSWSWGSGGGSSGGGGFSGGGGSSGGGGASGGW
ncbi:TPM domain-containing protein [Azorhizobium doebereinerae]|uniref:TPM domain-containing protein n=1 Tax=Azorhizobium doebereinerae TaxID=281091 RepID=UPI00041F924A|nr:TPM domain-containing protein [Azorhizobium doebereinerae]